MNVYDWCILPNVKRGSVALRQGVIVAETEPEAKSYLMASMNKDELELYQSRENILVLTNIYAYKEEI